MATWVILLHWVGVERVIGQCFKNRVIFAFVHLGVVVTAEYKQQRQIVMISNPCDSLWDSHCLGAVVHSNKNDCPFNYSFMFTPQKFAESQQVDKSNQVKQVNRRNGEGKRPVGASRKGILSHEISCFYLKLFY